MKLDKNITLTPLDYKNELLTFYKSNHLDIALKKSIFYLEGNRTDIWLLNFVGAIHFKLSNYKNAISYYDKILELDDKHFDALNNKGLSLDRLGDFKQAINIFEKLLKFNCNKNYVVLNNLGVTLKNVGIIEKSIEVLKTSIELNPNYLNSYNNLGISYLEKNDLKNAEYYFNQGLLIKNDAPEIYNNLGKIYLIKKKYEKAYEFYLNSISLNENDISVWGNLAICLLEMDLFVYNKNQELLFLQILNKNVQVNPRNISLKALQLLKLNPKFKNLMNKEFPLGIKDLDSLKELANNKLFSRILEVAPISDLEIEKLLIEYRKFILLNLSKVMSLTKLLPFLISLAKQCFINEYIFKVTENEEKLLLILVNNIKSKIKKGTYIDPFEISCIACYQKLYDFNIFKPEFFNSKIQSLIIEQIKNVQDEKEIEKYIYEFVNIKDKTSKLVKQQYEENPYPKWTEHIEPVSYNSLKNYLKKSGLRFDSDLLCNDYPKQILIAGCGTGKQAIDTALTFKNAEITAIDLSKASLSYAIRKSKEIGIRNINFMMCDINDIVLLNKRFDIIECVGVLHHMENPFIGWKKLASILNVGGFMFIGLYSEIARRNISSTRKIIKKLKILPTKTNILKFRNDLIYNKNKRCKNFVNWSDFYNFSEFRDLLFHVQEHCFSISKIKNYIQRLGFIFSGFENDEAKIKFLMNNKNTDLFDLGKWKEFEINNKDIFCGMYQFWIQKIKDNPSE